MPGSAEARKYRTAAVIEYVDLLVAPVHHVQIALLLVGRERESPCGAGRDQAEHQLQMLAGLRQLRCCIGLDPDVPDVVAVRVEHLDSVALAVAYINQSGLADGDAMDCVRENPARTGPDLLAASLAGPIGAGMCRSGRTLQSAGCRSRRRHRRRRWLDPPRPGPGRRSLRGSNSAPHGSASPSSAITAVPSSVSTTPRVPICSNSSPE